MLSKNVNIFLFFFFWGGGGGGGGGGVLKIFFETFIIFVEQR